MLKSIIGGRCIGLSLSADTLDDIPFRIVGNTMVQNINNDDNTHPDSSSFTAGFAGTIRNLTATCTYNGRDQPTYIVIQKNGVDTACICTIPAVEETNVDEVPGVVTGTGECTFIAGDVIRGVIRSADVYANANSLEEEDTVVAFASIMAEMEAPAYVLVANGTTYAQMSWHEYAAATVPENRAENDVRYCAGSIGGEAAYFNGVGNSLTPVADRSEDYVLPHIQALVRSPGTARNLRAFMVGTSYADSDNSEGITASLDLALTLNGVDTALAVETPPDPTEGDGLEEEFAEYVTNTDDDVALDDGDLVNWSWRWPHRKDTVLRVDNPQGSLEEYGTAAARNLSIEVHTDGTTADVFAFRYGSDDTREEYEEGYDYIGGGNVPTGEVDEEGNPITEFVYPRPDNRVNYLGWVSSITPATGEPDASTDETTYAAGIPSCTRFSRLRVYVGVYSGDAPLVIRSRIDGEYGDQTITIDGTGWFEDEENTDDVARGSTYCFEALVSNAATECFVRIDTLGLTTEETECPEGCTYLRGCENAYLLDELAERAFRMVGEDPSEPVYWTLDEMKRNVNDAYTSICRDTKALETIEGIELESESEAGTLSDRVNQIFRATFEDRKIENTSKYELDRTECDWENQVGFVSNYVTTQQTVRTITTYKAWNGDAANSEGPWLPGGAYEYEEWALTTAYVDGDRVTDTSVEAPFFGKTYAYVCILGHTSGVANRPGSGTNWETYWVPIALMVWATKNPAVLEGNCKDEPELPPWAHLAIAYRAAGIALRRRGEQRNEDLASAYDSLSDDYLSLLRTLVEHRAPERLLSMGGRMSTTVRRPKPWDQTIEDS